MTTASTARCACIFWAAGFTKPARVDPKHQEMIMLAAQTNLRWGGISEETPATPSVSSETASLPPGAEAD